VEGGGHGRPCQIFWGGALFCAPRLCVDQPNLATRGGGGGFFTLLEDAMNLCIHITLHSPFYLQQLKPTCPVCPPLRPGA
jgi:hypothetical protein